MAPPPEYDKEPKAPDKSATNISCEGTKALHNQANDQQSNSDSKPEKTAASNEVENNKHVETLDDGQLRALLDEAITYKNPKDREGKSSLFKELLEEVEQDEQACEAAARSVGTSRRPNRAHTGRGRHALPHSNSLQDLVAALAAEPRTRSRHHHASHHHNSHHHPSVSARAIHGGSLPSGVDTSFLLGEEPPAPRPVVGTATASTGGGGYLATVRCVNPPPLAERRVSASDANCASEVELLNRRSKPAFPMTYTARATLEIGSGAVCSGRATTTTTASNQVDSAIPFSCITTPEVVASCNTTCSVGQAVAVDPKPLQLELSYRAVASLTGSLTESAPHPAPASPPRAFLATQVPVASDEMADHPRSVISSNFNGLPLTRPNYGSTSATSDEFKKDENGNSLAGFSSPLSGSSQHKKPRRKKSSKNETVIKSHQIDGYQGNKDLNEVLRFIESHADGGRTKLPRAKHKDDDDKGKKRSTERRKDKEKVKRATSLEELSRTKLEDLTSKPGDAKPKTGKAAKAERRSWGDDRDALRDGEDHDFQTVTKRRRPRKREPEPAEADTTYEADGGGEPANQRPVSPRTRRVSAPPSDRSADSNDDLDSLHSMASQQAEPPPALPVSYADIARTQQQRHNIPDLIESCNFIGEGESAPQPPKDPPPAVTPVKPHEYPALEPRTPAQAPPRRAPPAVKTQTPSPKTTTITATMTSRKERTEECPAPDVVADRRPPVILADSATRLSDMDGVTFGFDINEQLLSGARRPRCDLLRDALDAGVGVVSAAGGGGGGGAGVAVRLGCLALRYVPPAAQLHSPQLHQIVDYVGAAWEDVIRCGGGKVRYFSE